MKTTLNPIRILLADDHPMLRQGIQVLGADELDMKFVAEASNGREAIEQFRKHRPDIALMDLEMPEVNGLMRLRFETNFLTRVLSSHDVCGRCSISRALKAGARGYLVKSLLRKNSLINFAVHAGQKRIPADLPRKLLITLRMTPNLREISP
jgi:DNA-binding NarL/FixJ family response regulator